MSDRAAVALALAVCAGAWWAAPVPLAAAVVMAVVALLLRRPAAVVVAGALLAASLGARAHAGLAPPTAAWRYEGEVTLLGDPERRHGAVRVDIRVGRRRVEAWARGAAGAELDGRAAGERVALVGRVRAPPDHARPWLARRHVSARLDVASVAGWRHGDPASRAANALRRTLVDGAEPLDGERRALFTGFVLGDTREQSVEVADDFRGAGLTHLLAVSGSNVALVITLAGPGLRRLPLTGRWLATLAVVGFFALVTRFEPSVLRAATMAAVAATATGLGRPATARRVLALAVGGLVLVDPFLVRSVGFQLSVAASAGILVLAEPVAARLPGPAVVGEVLAVTVAAQVGVAPVLIPTFGGLPLASLPANLLAVPAAGPLTTWGLTGGVLAGVLGPPADRWLHVPTGLLTGWVAGVARWGSGLPLGHLRAGHLLGLAALGAVAVAVRRSPGRRAVVAVGCAAVVASALLLPPSGDRRGEEVADGALLWRAGGAVVLLVDDPAPGRLLDRLRLAHVDRVDLLVVRRGTRPVAATVATLRSRLAVRAVAAPEGHAVRDAVVPSAGARLHLGGLVVRVRSTDPSLEVEVGLLAGGASARAPPRAALARAGSVPQRCSSAWAPASSICAGARW